MPAFDRVEIQERTDNGFVATMWERSAARKSSSSRGSGSREPDWLSYEHLESPYGANRGKFTITETPDGTRLHQVHETTQDISEGTALRSEWLELISQQLAAIKAGAERRAAG